jgi:hypothetical protein
MKPHPKIRKTIKWGGVAVTVLLVVVWIVSGTWTLGWVSRAGYQIALHHGAILMQYSPSTIDAAAVEGWRGQRAATHPAGMMFNYVCAPRCGSFAPVPGWYVIAPVVIPIVVVGVGSLIAWRFDTLAHRRARLNHCSNCNYDRAGIEKNAVCPECGQSTGTPQTTH